MKWMELHYDYIVIMDEIETDVCNPLNTANIKHEISIGKDIRSSQQHLVLQIMTERGHNENNCGLL